MKIKLFILSLFLCQTVFADEQTSYLNARNGKVLHVPAHLDDSKISRYFVIKATNSQPGSTPVPPGSALEKHLRRHPSQRPGLPAESVTMKEVRGEPVLWVNQNNKEAYKTLRAGISKQNLSTVAEPMRQSGVSIYDAYSTFDRIREDTPVYDVQIRRQGHATVIRIRDQQGGRINTKTARRLLASISEGMHGTSADNVLVSWLKNRNGTYKFG